MVEERSEGSGKERTGRQMPSHVFSSRHVPGAAKGLRNSVAGRPGGAARQKTAPRYKIPPVIAARRDSTPRGVNSINGGEEGGDTGVARGLFSQIGPGFFSPPLSR